MGQRFDLEAWMASRPPLTKSERNWAGRTIDRPKTLAATLWARRQPSVREALVNPSPCDICLYAIGQPEAPESTHLGGAAWIPSGMDRPIDDTGEPAVFLAQVYFGDSADIIASNLPGVALQIYSSLGEEPWATGWEDEGEDLILVWLTSDQLQHGEWHPHPDGRTPCAPVCCHLNRAVDFGHIESADSTERDEAEQFRVLDGTKIGGRPVWIQSSEEDHSPEDQLICAIGSMYHITARCRDVFINEPSLSPAALKKLGGSPCWGDMGIINVMRRPTGEFHTTFECA